jgi:hypothetical protein
MASAFGAPFPAKLHFVTTGSSENLPARMAAVASTTFGLVPRLDQVGSIRALVVGGAETEQAQDDVCVDVFRRSQVFAPERF